MKKQDKTLYSYNEDNFTFIGYTDEEMEEFLNRIELSDNWLEIN